MTMQPTALMLPDEFNLTGRVAVVTGGSEGIGAATAELLCRRGADVVVASRTRETLERLADRVRDATGRRCLAVPTDVRDEAQIEALVARTMEQFGRIDILVNNAGGTGQPSSADLTVPETKAMWDGILDWNLTSAVLCSQAALPHFIERGSGAIVNLSSMAGVHGTRGYIPYSATKSAVQMFTRVAAAEWGGHGIRVNCVAPGLTATDRLVGTWSPEVFERIALSVKPTGRAGRPDELAQAIVFLASDAASYISGETLAVAGGPNLPGGRDG